MRRFAILVLAVCILFVPTASSMAVGAEETPAEAAELTASADIACSSGSSAILTDGREETYANLPAGAAVTITSEAEISSLYVIFDRIYGAWTLSDGTADITCGENGYLHEYIDVAERFGHAPNTLTLTFAERDCSLSEVHVFGAGEAPSWVQVWEPPCEEADLVLFSTHIDDEQLFFAGVLPYYAGECGLDVQVVYFTDPFSYHDRPHEQLNGLWTVGVRHYPVSGELVDMRSYTAAEAYAHQRAYGFTREDIVRFQVEMLRRFRPHVVVGHDINGEYGHGQHMINSETLMEGLDLAADASYDPDSAALYGVWDTPKAYIHLWPENPIVMDWDVPLEAFGGRTAFQMSQEGFRCQKSQLGLWLDGWIFGQNGSITKASQITQYSPCNYGLYRTRVGPDAAGGDMFENIPLSYAGIRAEIRQREEEARLEEIRRREEEEARAAEAARLAEERSRAEVESRGEAAVTAAAVTAAAVTTEVAVIAAAALIMAAAMLLCMRPGPQNNRTQRRRRS